MSNDDFITTVDVPIYSSKGLFRQENLLVLQLEEGLFRLLKSPGFVQGLAAGDEFRLDHNNILGFQVTKRGQNICLQFFIDADRAEHFRKVMTPLAEEIGGWLDGFEDRERYSVTIFTFPVQVGFPSIESFAEKGRSTSRSFDWVYGNVYDPIDGVTALGWWELTDT